MVETVLPGRNFGRGSWFLGKLTLGLIRPEAEGLVKRGEPPVNACQVKILFDSTGVMPGVEF